MKASAFDVSMTQRIARLLLSMAGVVVIAVVAFSWTPVNATTAGFAFLLYILVIASVWGFGEAAVSSIFATPIFNFYFLPPVGQFTIADPQNWIALVSFLATSLVASRLSTAAKLRALDAEQRQRDLERLYTFGRSILLIDSGQPFARQLIGKLADTFEMAAVALYEPRSGDINRAGPVDFDGMDAQLREAAVQGTTFSDPAKKRVITAVRLGSEPIASLALQGEQMTDSVLQSIANLVAIGLERAKAQELALEVEAARRSEHLRTTLLDAMAHEFKTPLTSIRAATTALLSNPDQQPPNADRILKIADEEAAHLEELIDNALDMAHLDSQQLNLDLELASLDTTIRETVESMRKKIEDRPLRIEGADDLPPIKFDRRLVKLAFKQILDNALKYSPTGKPIEIRLARLNGDLTVNITDHGNGISKQEVARIFERFYRSPSVEANIPGSGLGLSIAHRIMEAHGGHLTACSEPGETTFSFTLPIKRGEKA